MATFFLDYENGNDNYAGTSFDPLASGTDGRASTYAFSSATANFPNDGTIVGQKNLLGSTQYDNNNAWSGAGFVTPIQLYNISPPSGLYKVWTFVESTSSASHSLRPNANTYTLNTSLQYTISYYVKAYGRNIVVLRMGASDTKGARFDISSGTILQTGASASSAISDAGDGWYRISLTATPTSINELIYFNLTDGTYSGTGEQNYTGDGMRGVLVTGAQLEQSSSVTSYEKPPEQYLSIFNGSIYAVYHLMSYISSTSLHLTPISGGTGNPSITVDRQYYIGGRWKSLSTSTGSTSTRIHPGDTFRLKASPDPTSIGNVTWTSGIMSSTKSISSSTNASPISVTVNSHGYSTGDTVYITGHTTNLNANGMWEITVTGTNTFTLDGSTGNGTGGGTGTVRLKNNAVVRLASSLTQNIASTGNRGTGRTVWTASANAQTLLDTSDTKEGDVADYIGVTSSFTTGKAAYKTLSSTLDLSGYQQLSLWIKLASGGLNTTDSDVSIVLCSDSTGDIAVNTFNIPRLIALNRWTPFTIDLGTNLGSSINSVALYINNDRGAQVFYVSNIIACKASSSDDSLNLQSLIGKNTSGETWYGIQSINGTRVILDNSPSAKVSEDYIRGYIGTSETVTTYKRETIKTDRATGATSFIQGINEVNYNETRTYIEGGWDRTNMNTQSGETIFDGLNGWGYGIQTGANLWGACFNKVGAVRYYAGIYQYTGARYTRITNCFSNNNDSFGFYLLNQVNDNYLNNLYAYCNGSVGLSINSFAYNPYISNSYFKSNRYDGIQSEHNYGTIDSCVCDNNGRSGMYFSYDYKKNVTNCTTSYNNFGVYFSRSSEAFIKNLTTVGNLTGSVGADICGYVGISDSNLQEPAALGTTLGFAGNKVYFQNLDQVADNHFIGLDYGSIYSSSAVTRSGSGYSWALAPTNSYRSATYPLDLKVSTFAVQANKIVNISAYVRRTNANLTCRLRIPGGQIGGATNDLISYASGSADTWEEVTMSFLPTENGVIDLFFEVYGGSTYTGYIDDLTISQS